jgi:hypothetical protein
MDLRKIIKDILKENEGITPKIGIKRDTHRTVGAND